MADIILPRGEGEGGDENSFVIHEEVFNAEDAEVHGKLRRESPLRPPRKPLRPLRLIRI